MLLLAVSSANATSVADIDQTFVRRVTPLQRVVVVVPQTLKLRSSGLVGGWASDEYVVEAGTYESDVRLTDDRRRVASLPFERFSSGRLQDNPRFHCDGRRKQVVLYDFDNDVVLDEVVYQDCANAGGNPQTLIKPIKDRALNVQLQSRIVSAAEVARQ